MNEDLTAVRELTDEMASSRRDASLATSWVAVTERGRPRPQRTMTRRLVPVAAGLVVVMLVVAGWYVVGPGAGSRVVLPADGQQVPVAQAWDAIIAAAQSARPTAIPDASVIYVKQTGAGAMITNDGTPWTMQNQDRGSWFDPRGMVFLMYRENGGANRTADPAPAGPPAQVDLTHITPQWIASLPTDPGALRDVLLRQSKGIAGDWSDRHGLWEGLAELFHTADLAIPVDVRTAIYRVIAQEKGLAANRTVVGGRDVYVITRAERDSAQQLVFDPATGRCIGRRSLFLGDDPGVPADRVMSWSIWDQHVVAKVGDEK
jgi:hypothetical protein